MKKSTLATRVDDSREPGSTKNREQPSEATELSPERISEGVSTRTEVLAEILEQERRLDNFRYWGINE